MSDTAQLALTLKGKVRLFCDIFHLRETYEVLIVFEIIGKNAPKSPFNDETNIHNTFSIVNISTNFFNYNIICRTLL